MPKPPDPAKPGKGKLTLAPLTPDQALAAALRVKPADVKRLEAEEAAGKRAKAAGRKKRGRE